MNETSENSSKTRVVQQQKKFVFRSLIFLCALISLLLAAFWYFSTERNAQFTSNDADLGLEQKTADEIFRELLGSNDTKKLLVEIQRFKDDGNLDLPIRLDYMDKRIALSNAIIDLNTDAESVIIAKKTKIKTLAFRVLLTINNDIYNDSDLGELSLFADSLAFEENANLVKEIQSAKLIGNVARYFKPELDSESRLGYLKIIQEQFRKIAENFSNETSAAATLFDLARIIQSRTDSSISNPLIKSFVSNFGNSEQSNIVEMVRELESSMTNAPLNYDVVLKRKTLYRDDEIDEMLDQFQNTSADDKLRDISAERWLERAAELISADEIAKASTIVSILKDYAPNTKLGKVQSLLTAIGTTFNSNGMLNSSLDTVDFSSTEIKNRVVLIVSKESLRESQRKLVELDKRLSRFFSQPETELSLVLAHGKNEENEINLFKTFEEKLTNVKVYFIEQESSRFQAMTDELLVDQLPYLVLVVDGKVRSINPAVNVLESILDSPK